MLLKWKQVQPSVLTLLKDETPEGQTRNRRYDPDDVVAWWNNAQIRLATMKPQSRHQVYKADDGCVIELPDLFYKPVGLFFGQEPITRIPLDRAVLGETGYYIIEDKLVLANFAQVPRQWTMIYHSFFPQIENEKSSVHVPLWAIEACGLYVAMQAVTREAMGDARYRKFVSPEDAPGNPTHNPFLTVAKWLNQRFYEIVNIHVDDDPDYRQAA